MFLGLQTPMPGSNHLLAPNSPECETGATRRIVVLDSYSSVRRTMQTCYTSPGEAGVSGPEGARRDGDRTLSDVQLKRWSFGAHGAIPPGVVRV